MVWLSDSCWSGTKTAKRQSVCWVESVGSGCSNRAGPDGRVGRLGLAGFVRVNEVDPGNSDRTRFWFGRVESLVHIGRVTWIGPFELVD